MKTSVYLYSVRSAQYMNHTLQHDYCFTKSNITAAHVYPGSTLLLSPHPKYSTRTREVNLFFALFIFL
jgi:hypothetical protein